MQAFKRELLHNLDKLIKQNYVIPSNMFSVILRSVG